MSSVYVLTQAAPVRSQTWLDLNSDLLTCFQIARDLAWEPGLELEAEALMEKAARNVWRLLD